MDVWFHSLSPIYAMKDIFPISINTVNIIKCSNY